MEKAGVLHTSVAIRRTWFNRVFAIIYTSAIFAILFHHFQNLIVLINTSTTKALCHALMLLADVVLAFMWATHQSFRMFPIRRHVFPENLDISQDQYPALDVFICTADPYKEPPIGVVNTALAVMAYDYPTDKLSIYLSDDGGSQLTLFALMEAAVFAAHWLPFCSENQLLERSPEAYFKSLPKISPEIHQIKLLYESMKRRVENAVNRGSVDGCYDMNDDNELYAFDKWAAGFTTTDHPSVVQVLLESRISKDVSQHAMPNLIYVSREKRTGASHHFKAGALNVLLRVSATMTNAPIILTIDCDMLSNDPRTPLRALCYYMEPHVDSKLLAFVQFPQRFTGINKTDIYGAEFKNWTEIDATGLDGILGPNYMGTGCFFKRRAFFGGPSSIVLPEAPELSPDHLVKSSIHAANVLTLAHQVAGCNYEAQTEWGSKMGFKYGSSLEDYYNGYRLHCMGWRSVFCNPKRPAFLGIAPITLHDLLTQTKRWSIGLLDMAFCKYSPLVFGTRSMNLFQSLCYTHYSFWPILSIPITIYAFMPQIALINSLPIFPKMSDPWFYIYAFSIVGAYVQDFFDFILAGGEIPKWWNNQRMWMIRGMSSFPFALLEFLLGCFGLPAFEYSVTSKVIDPEQNHRYDSGIFEFGVPTLMFFPVTTAAILNFAALSDAIVQLLMNGGSLYEDMFLQMFITGFVVINSWPIYEAIVFRTDKGKMPVNVTLKSVAFALVLYLAFSSVM